MSLNIVKDETTGEDPVLPETMKNIFAGTKWWKV
jgi:hypothetical protein